MTLPGGFHIHGDVGVGTGVLAPANSGVLTKDEGCGVLADFIRVAGAEKVGERKGIYLKTCSVISSAGRAGSADIQVGASRTSMRSIKITLVFEVILEQYDVNHFPSSQASSIRRDTQQAVSTSQREDQVALAKDGIS